MRLCHVVASLQEQHGGPSKSVRSLCRALARAGHNVELFATDPSAPAVGTDEEYEGGNLRVRTFRRDFPQRLSVSRGLRVALTQSDADVIHHHGLWLRTLHYSRCQAVQRRRPLVISPRGMMSTWAWAHHAWRKRVSRLLTHPAALEQAAGWHATSVDEKSEIAARGFPQPVCVAPNGVVAPLASDISAARTFWHNICPESASRPTALFYGRFHQKKRVIELIDVWLKAAPPQWLLLLVGLPEEYTPAVLETYAAKPSGAGRVRAFSGAGRPPPYPVASLFVLPSHNENFGLTIAEAMAHGVPALVTDTTPWSALNVDGRGWCVPWADFASAISAATSEGAEARVNRGERARHWVLREFAWERAAGVLSDFYATLAASCA